MPKLNTNIPGYIKDTDSGVIININNDEYVTYQSNKTKTKKISSLQDDIEELKKSFQSIKKDLEELLAKKNG